MELPDRARLRGRGLRAGAPPDPEAAPEWALVLLGRAPAEAAWPTRWVRWPDFRLPQDPEDARAAPGEAHRRAVAWVRERYHPRAVETPWQRRYVRRFAAGS